MKFALSTILAAASLVVSASASDDDQLHAAAFAAVVPGDHTASDWKKYRSDGPLPPLVQVDPMADMAPQKKHVGRKLGHDGGGAPIIKEWWPTQPWTKPIEPPRVGYYAIDTDEYGGSMEVQNKNREQCIYIGEGIGKDDWVFGITRGPVPGMGATFDTYLQLFEEWSPVSPIYKAFQGAKQLCIGEKKGNIAYLYIVFKTGCYWLIGKPDAGRDDHLPKLKIRDQDRRRERARRLGGGSGSNEADDLNDAYNKGPGDDVIVRFRDGPGIVNTFWEIYNNGLTRTAPHAKWYFVPKDDVPPKTCDDISCPTGTTCDPRDLTCKDEEQLIPCIAVIDEDDMFDTSICPGDQAACWAKFRAEYPDRPFCLIGIEPDNIDTPANFLADPNAKYVQNVPRDCNKSGTVCNTAEQDWLSLCGFENIQSSTVEFLGLFVDDSGSMKVENVQPSINKLAADLGAKGIGISVVENDDENWIAPFLTDLIPEFGGCAIPSPPNGMCKDDRIGRTQNVKELGKGEYICDGSYAFGVANSGNDAKFIKYSCTNGWVTKWQTPVGGDELKINDQGKLALLSGSSSVWEVNCGSLDENDADNVVLRIDASKTAIVELNGKGKFDDGDWGLRSDGSDDANGNTCKYVATTPASF